MDDHVSQAIGRPDLVRLDSRLICLRFETTKVLPADAAVARLRGVASSVPTPSLPSSGESSVPASTSHGSWPVAADPHLVLAGAAGDHVRPIRDDLDRRVRALLCWARSSAREATWDERPLTG